MNTRTTMTRRFLTPMLGTSLLLAGSSLACPPANEHEGAVKTVEWTTASIPTMWSTAVATASVPQVWFSPATVAWTPQDAKKDAPKQTVVSAKNITIVINDGERKLELSFDGDKRSAKIDGQLVPADRIVETDTHLIIRGKEGETLFKLDRLAPGTATLAIEGEGAVYGVQWDDQLALDRRGDRDDLYTFTTSMKMPKAMIGITMAEIEDVTAAQLGVKPDEVVLVTGVAPNLPADKAGLKKFDVIIKVDGEKPVTEAKIREVVTSREPGEKVGLVVLRESRPMEFEIELQEFKPDGWGNFSGAVQLFDTPERLRALQQAIELPGDLDWEQISPERLLTLQNQAISFVNGAQAVRGFNFSSRSQIEALRKNFSIELQKAITDERIRQTVEDAFNRAAGEIEQHANQFFGDLPLSVQIVPKADGEQALVLPRLTEQSLRFGNAMESSRNSASPDRLLRLEERMVRLEALLEKLVDQRAESRDR